MGGSALRNTTTGGSNTATRFQTLNKNTVGTNNTASGCVALFATTANANAVTVVIDSAGQLGTVSSSARFKDHIASMGETSEAVLELKPVTFHYKRQ